MSDELREIAEQDPNFIFAEGYAKEFLATAERHARNAGYYRNQAQDLATDDAHDIHDMERLVDTVHACAMAAQWACDAVARNQKHSGAGALLMPIMKAARAWAAAANDAWSAAEHCRPRSEEETEHYYQMLESDQAMGELPLPLWQVLDYGSPEEYAEMLTSLALRSTR